MLDLLLGLGGRCFLDLGHAGVGVLGELLQGRFMLGHQRRSLGACLLTGLLDGRLEVGLCLGPDRLFGGVRIDPNLLEGGACFLTDLFDRRIGVASCGFSIGELPPQLLGSLLGLRDRRRQLLRSIRRLLQRRTQRVGLLLRRVHLSARGLQFRVRCLLLRLGHRELLPEGLGLSSGGVQLLTRLLACRGGGLDGSPCLGVVFPLLCEIGLELGDASGGLPRERLELCSSHGRFLQ